MNAHIVTVINSRTCGLAPMMMVNLSDEDGNHHANSDESVESEDGELSRLEIRSGKKVFTKSRPDPSRGKGGGKGKTNNVSAEDALVTFEQIAEPKLISMEDHQNLRQKGRMLEIGEDEETETSQNVPLGTIDLVSFEVLSDRGDEVEDDESTNETKEMMPPLPPGSWFKRTETFCGSFGNLAMKITKTKRMHSWMGSKSSPTLCNHGSLGTKHIEV